MLICTPYDFLLKYESFAMSGFDIAAPINITGDTGNVFILH
ncbi:MAG: hypothetical protein VB023_06655 [Oscillibacter sp.]|nr:hypothetical protein [Oscillibacter sp.]